MSAEEKQILLGAIDSLAVALAGHNHTFTTGERAVYDEARMILTGSYDERDEMEDTDGDGWK